MGIHRQIADSGNCGPPHMYAKKLRGCRPGRWLIPERLWTAVAEEVVCACSISSLGGFEDDGSKPGEIQTARATLTLVRTRLSRPFSFHHGPVPPDTDGLHSSSPRWRSVCTAHSMSGLRDNDCGASRCRRGGFICDALAPVSRDDARHGGLQRDSRAATQQRAGQSQNFL